MNRLKTFLNKYRAYREFAYVLAYVVAFIRYLYRIGNWGFLGLVEGIEEATHDFKREVYTVAWVREKVEALKKEAA